MASGDVYERTFPERGEWIYYCRTHARIMRGIKVRVR